MVSEQPPAPALLRDHRLPAGWVRGAIVALAVCGVLYVARPILIPLALSILLAFILSPLVDRFEKMRMGSIFSVVVAALIASAVATIFAWVIALQLFDFSERLPDYKSNLVGRIRQLQELAPASLSKASSTLAEIQQQIDSGQNEVDPESKNQDAKSSVDGVADVSSTETSQGSPPTAETLQVDLVAPPPTMLQQLYRWLGPTVSPLASAGIIAVLTVFLLLEREDFRGRLVQLFASSNLAIATRAMNEATAGITRWLQMMFLINAMYGVAVALGLYAIGLPNPLLWGIVGFACRFLPYIGPIMAAAFPFLLSLAAFDGWARPLLLIAYLGALELTVNTVLEPWLYGRSVGLSPLGVVLAVLFWAWIWGPAGLFLAIPITLWLVVLGRHIPQFHFFAVLLGDLREMPSYHNLYQRLLAFNGEQAVGILEKQFQNSSIAATFEQVLIPLLQRAELDRRAGAIAEEQFEFIHETLDNAVECSATPESSLTSLPNDEKERMDEPHLPRADRSILIVPIANRADEIAAKVLLKSAKQLPHLHCSLVSTALLANEVVDRAVQERFDAVVVSGISPFTPAKGRLIIKRLRQALPQLTVIAAQWRGAPEQASHAKTVDRSNQILERIEDILHALDTLPAQGLPAEQAREQPPPPPSPETQLAIRAK